MIIKSRTLAPVIIIIFIAGITLSMGLNLWKTESTKIPARYISGDFEGEYNPADIRGSYSLSDIANSFEVSVEVLAKAFGINGVADMGAFQVKNLETIYTALPDGGEVGTDAVRLFVARYTDLPYTPEESTRLPNPAITLLKDKLAPADLEALRAIGVSLSDLQTGVLESNPGDTEIVHEESTEAVIKGKTTFNELLEWGLTKEKIEEILGMEMGARSQTVRDFLYNQGLEFSGYKTKLQELLDSN